MQLKSYYGHTSYSKVQRFDLKNDGEVTLEEFSKVLSDYEYSEAEVRLLFQR